MIEVLLADPDPLARAAVAAVLRADPDVRIAAEAGDGHEALELAHTHRPGLALLDIALPGLDGIAVATELTRAMPTIGVALLTTLAEDDPVAAALTSGARGVLLRNGDRRALLDGVKAVAGGAAFLPREVAAHAIAQLDSGVANRTPSAVRARELIVGLTPRESEVLALVGLGLTDAEIAQRLCVVDGTVPVFVSTILRSLHVDNRVQAAVIAHEAGLVHDC